MNPKSVRISVVVDKEIADNLRTIQASMIRDSKQNVSFSQIVNLVLRRGISQLNNHKKYE